MFYNKLRHTGYIKSSRHILIGLLLLFSYTKNLYAQQDSINNKNFTLEVQIFANTNYTKVLSEKYDFKNHFKTSIFYSNCDFSTNYYGLAAFIHK